MPRLCFGIKLHALGLAGSLLMLASHASADNPYFMGLGSLPGIKNQCVIRKLSADGSTVIGNSYDGETVQAFRWTANDGMVGLGDLPSGEIGSVAYDVSADGSVVVGESDTHLIVDGTYRMFEQAFRWTPIEGITGLDFPDLGPGCCYYLAFGASAITGDGSCVLGDFYTEINNGITGQFRWTAADGLTFIAGAPGATGNFGIWDVSADGSVYAAEDWDHVLFGYRTFRWSAAAGWVELGYLPGGGTTCTFGDLADDGAVIVGGSDSDLGYEAYRWTEDTGMLGLGLMPGGSVYSWASAVSSDGSVIVGFGDVGNNEDAGFIWTPSRGMRLLGDVLSNDYGLDLRGWSQLLVYDISADGQTLAGEGINPNGDQESWIASLGQRGDVNHNGVVDMQDLLTVITSWGACTNQSASCPSDIAPPGGDGTVGIDDLLLVLGQWN